MNLFPKLIVAGLAISLSSLAALAGELPIVYPVSAVPVGDPACVERSFFGFPKGELLEAILFQKAWIAANPVEECVVVTESIENGGLRVLSGTALYSKGGAVFAHSVKLGTAAIADLTPSMLRSGDLDRLAKCMAAVSVSAVKKSGVPQSTDVADVLVAANSAFNSPDADFPGAGGRLASNLAELSDDLSGHRAGGKTWLVFDWCDWHCFYRPEVGVVVQQIPENPLTQRTFVCGANAALVECAVFAGDWRKLNPSENARVVVLEQPRNSPVQNSAVFTAYTKAGRVYFFSDELRKDKASSVAADAFDDNGKLIAAFTKFRDEVQAADPVINHFPGRLAGDSPAMIARRALNRLLEHNNSTNMITFKGKKAPGGSLVSVSSPYVFSYNAVTQTAYITSVRESDMAFPNRLLDGVINGKLFLDQNPNESACVISALENGRKPRSYALVTHLGKVSFLNDDPKNEISVPGVSSPLDKLEPKAVFSAVRVASSQPRGSITTRDADKPFGKVSDPRTKVPSVAKALTAAGISVRDTPTTTELWPDGRVRIYNVPSLAFSLNGVEYTYSIDEACQASSGIVYRD